MKHSQLLGNYLDTVVREQFRQFNETLPRTLFDSYLQDCRSGDPDMPANNLTCILSLTIGLYYTVIEYGIR